MEEQRQRQEEEARRAAAASAAEAGIATAGAEGEGRGRAYPVEQGGDAGVAVGRPGSMGVEELGGAVCGWACVEQALVLLCRSPPFSRLRRRPAEDDHQPAGVWPHWAP